MASSNSPQLPPDNFSASSTTTTSITNNDICPPHPGFFQSMCIRCSKFKTPDDDNSTIAFSYIHSTLRLSTGEIDRLRNEHKKNMLRDKKLVLVLDLDYTLINSNTVNPKEEEEEKEEEGLLRQHSDQNLFKLESLPRITKLRPFVHTFLERAHRKFELYVYTTASRTYAMEVVKLLDPRNIYFDSRVISRSDTHLRQKSLDVVLLGAETTTVILDDQMTKWPWHKKNLILMDKYNYFKSSHVQFGGNAKSLSELMVDESESDGALASILNVLEHVHYTFFDPKLGAEFSSRDVRRVLRKIRRKVLQGCKIAFGPELNSRQIRNMAALMGAKCSTEVDDSITHLVCSVETRTNEADWSLKNGKFLVKPGWIEAAYYLWRRQREEDYVINISNKRRRDWPLLETPSKRRRISYDPQDFVAQ